MRGKQAPKRRMEPDPKYHHLAIAKFIATMMKKGKKSVAQQVMYDALALLVKKMNVENPVQVFEEAIKNVAPVVEVRSRRIGGSNYQIPFPVRVERRQALAFRWLIEAARGKKGKAMSERLADELMAAAKKEGAAMKKREDVHRMAEANRAFAHFAR